MWWCCWFALIGNWTWHMCSPESRWDIHRYMSHKPWYMELCLWTWWSLSARSPEPGKQWLHQSWRLEILMLLFLYRCVMILLMVQKSCVHPLRLVVYPIISRVLYVPDGAWFLPSSPRRLSQTSNMAWRCWERQTIERHVFRFIQSEKKSPFPKKHRRMRGAWMNTTCFMYMYFRYNETNLYFSEGQTMSCSPLSTRIRWTSAGGFGFGCMGFLWRSLGRSSSEDALVLFCSIFAWLGSSLHSNCTTLPSNLRGSERAQCFRFRFWIPQ